MRSRRLPVLLAAAMMAGTGCLHRVPSPLPVVELGPPLTRLSRSVDAVTDLTSDSRAGASTRGAVSISQDDTPVPGQDLAPPPAPALLGDPALLAAATAHDPSLLEPFHGYHVEAAARGGYGVVLVCNAAGTVALLEDAGCTARLDIAWYRNDTPSPCVFTIDPAVLCAPKVDDETNGPAGPQNRK